MWSSKWSFTFILLDLLICDVLSEDGESVFVAHNNAILQLGPNTSSVVVSADSLIMAFDIHNYWRQLFWATDFFLYRTPLYDLQTTSVVAVTGRVAGGGLAVDWTHQVVYWSDMSRGRVEAAHLDGRRRRVVYETDWTLGALALDPRVGEIFWIESTHKEGQLLTRIKCADLTGAHVEILLASDNIHHGGPLAIDTENWTLYFYRVNGSVGEQWELNYGGLRPHGGVKLFERKDGLARSLALTHEGFYYSSGEGLSLGTWQRKSYSLFYGNITRNIFVLKPYFTLVDEDLSNVSQIRVLSIATQPRYQDVCGVYRCQHECAGPQAYECICRYGFVLQEDLRSCSENGYALYSTPTTFGRITLGGEQHMTLFNDSAANIQAFDIHMKSRYIYWADLYAQAIYRAPVDTPARKTPFAQNVSAYGLAVDWIHEHVYWSEDSRIMVASLDGDKKITLLNNLDSTSDVAVDPINRFLFWTECGESLSLKRASLSGDDVTSLSGHVTCGSTITADLWSRTVYWLDWTGTVRRCGYDGKNCREVYNDLARAITVLNGRLLWFPVDREMSSSPEGEVFVHKHEDIQPSTVKVVKGSQQSEDLNMCSETDCTGLCLPADNMTVPLCLCPGEACSSGDETKMARGAPLLELVAVTPFSATLRCAGPLLRYPVQQPTVHVTEVASLVDRPQGLRPPWYVRVGDKEQPFTIDTLNPATSYSLVLRNRVTRGSYSLTLQTPPPPLRVDRLPLVTLPGATPNPSWLPQGVHYFDPNPWQVLILREYMLLLISKTKYYLSDSYHIDQPTSKLISQEIKDNFLILKHYKTKEEFDDDPTMHLGNIPWGEQFWLVMVQVLEYQGARHLDCVYSEMFVLPDPLWDDFVEDILEDNDQYRLSDY